MDVQLRDAAALSLHWHRGDGEAVAAMIAAAVEGGPAVVRDLVCSLLAVGEITGATLDRFTGATGGAYSYGALLEGFAAEASLAAEGIAP